MIRKLSSLDFCRNEFNHVEQHDLVGWEVRLIPVELRDDWNKQILKCLKRYSGLHYHTVINYNDDPHVPLEVIARAWNDTALVLEKLQSNQVV